MNKKNPATLKEQYDSVIDAMDTEQLAHTENTINERAQGQDMTPDKFVEHSKADNRDESINANPNFEKFAEMSRFNREIAIDEQSLRANNGMPKVGKLDDTASKKVRP